MFICPDQAEWGGKGCGKVALSLWLLLAVRMCLEGAVYLVLQSFASRLAGHSVKWFTDKQGALHTLFPLDPENHIFRMLLYRF